MIGLPLTTVVGTKQVAVFVVRFVAPPHAKFCDVALQTAHRNVVHVRNFRELFAKDFCVADPRAALWRLKNERKLLDNLRPLLAEIAKRRRCIGAW